MKGVTIFRADCKRTGILTTTNKENNNKDNTPDTNTNKPVLKRGDIIDCSNDLIGKKRKLITGCGSLHCLAFFDPDTGDLLEVYLNKGSTGGCNSYMIGLSRFISNSCRLGANIFTIKDQLDSVPACPSYVSRKATKHDTSPGSCCPQAVGNALLDMWKEVRVELDLDETTEPNNLVDQKKLQRTTESKQIVKNPESICPECGTPLRFEGGCNSCPNCGYSKCN